MIRRVCRAFEERLRARVPGARAAPAVLRAFVLGDLACWGVGGCGEWTRARGSFLEP